MEEGERCFCNDTHSCSLVVEPSLETNGPFRKYDTITLTIKKKIFLLENFRIKYAGI